MLYWHLRKKWNPKAWQMYLELAGQVMAHIKTYDQEVYETKIEDKAEDKNLVVVF